ncbi:unnamed protein product [Effrenium voratum]|nr:unnamed protein product [Effrenium voratum]
MAGLGVAHGARLRISFTVLAGYGFDTSGLFRSQHADALALLFALLGGILMGAYPVPIKAFPVLQANPHPVIFQCYKTFWVFVAGWIFVLVRWFRQEEPVYSFTWWGTVSALGWIPSGLFTIAAVPRIGVGMAIAVNTGTASVLSFLVFWLVLGEAMKQHEMFGHQIYLAPVYLVCVLLGMIGLVKTSQGARRNSGAKGTEDAEDDTETVKPNVGTGPEDLQEVVPEIPEIPEIAAKAKEKQKETKSSSEALGLVAAALAGVFSAIMYGAVNLGRRAAMRAAGCAEDESKCPPEFVEAFNDFGSWVASFGVGATLITAVALGAVCGQSVVRKQPLPQPHFRSLWLPGSAAGLLWSLGNVFQTAAVVRGGNAVMLPANQAIQLVTSGAFGLLYYREVAGTLRSLQWFFFALWTLGAILLLSQDEVLRSWFRQLSCLSQGYHGLRKLGASRGCSPVQTGYGAKKA